MCSRFLRRSPDLRLIATSPLIAANPQSLQKARRVDGDIPLQFLEDAAVDEKREESIKEFYGRVRFSSNDRSVPESDQQ
jgi:hypothetical protein